MIRKLQRIWELRKDKEGQGLAEYALIIGLIAVASVAVLLTGLSGGLTGLLNTAAAAL